jgi:hypothetical protein
MYLLFVWCGTYGSGFEVGISITRAISGGGGGRKIETFWGPEKATIVASAIWAQKREAGEGGCSIPPPPAPLSRPQVHSKNQQKYLKGT